MPDPATGLQRFESSSAGLTVRHNVRPAIALISGGRPGVGATTLAVHLATALAQEALRVVLIDANLCRADVAARCNLTSSLGIEDVLAGRKNIHEVLQRGPAGMQILSGVASPTVSSSLGQRAMQRLMRQIQSLGRHTDWLIIDAGNQPSEFTANLWSMADHLLVVTSPDAVAVMDTYALIKTLLSRHSLRPAPSLVVNGVKEEAVAADVHRRIDQSCRRFLGLAIDFAGAVPHDPAILHQTERSFPLAQALTRLIRHFLDQQQASGARPVAA